MQTFYLVDEPHVPGMDDSSVGCTTTSSKFMARKFHLVCDLSWVVATIMSLQMAGLIAGQLLAGHLADAFGRKPPLFVSMVILFLAHLVSYFSVNWSMFAVCRIFVGIGCAFFLTVDKSIMSEYSLSKWRSVVIGVPSWPLQTSVFALVAWLVGDWRSITLIISVMSAASLLFWWIVPESFRWHIAHDNRADADKIVKRIARWNNQSIPDTDTLVKLASATQQPNSETASTTQQQSPETDKRRFSVIELFRKLEMAKKTFPLMICWFALGLSGYGITFGIQKLSGNIYINLVLFSIVTIPSKLVSIYLQNRYGRKYAAMLCFFVCACGTFVAGAVQYTDGGSLRDRLTNGFALLANLGIHAAWGPMQTLTVETYPTVIRSIAFGFLSTMGRVGSVIGPQFMYLSGAIPGLLYFICGATSTISIVAMFCLPETKELNLKDKLRESTKSGEDIQEENIIE